jgi:hypothetical protein
LLAASAWAVGLAAVLAGPAPYLWHPTADDRWHWPDESIVDGSVDVVVLDPFRTTAQEVARWHADGTAVVCQLRAGVWEPGRPDASRVDPSLLGDTATADARWLDVRRIDALSELLRDRLALCAGKGFDGVALADVDGYAAATGFPLTEADQRAFNTAVVGLAHGLGLRVAMVADERTPIPSNVDVTVRRPGVAAGSGGTSTRSGS